MEEPAHLTIIKRNLHWERVLERIQRYKNFAKIFPLTELQKCSKKAPFYCHYMGWRLGTWQDEEWFEFFDWLLEIGTNLPGWDKDRIPGGCEFENFWGFIWELQVAVFFAYRLGLGTEWLKAGPDIQVRADSSRFFVECTTYRKSFGLEEFISELFRCINQDIRIEHLPFMRFTLPKGNKNEIETLLNNLFKPYLDSSFLPRKIRETQNQSPILLPVPPTARNFYVFLENPDAPNQDFELGQMLHTTSNPEDFLETAIKETVCKDSKKASANRLPQSHPNLVMVNFLLGKDWQLAKTLRSMQEPELAETLDCVLFTACGIDKIPTLESSFVYSRSENHPIKHFMKGQSNN